MSEIEIKMLSEWLAENNPKKISGYTGTPKKKDFRGEYKEVKRKKNKTLSKKQSDRFGKIIEKIEG